VIDTDFDRLYTIYVDEQKKLLVRILEITQTEDDIDAFVDLFINLLFQDTVHALIQSLPAARRESVGKKWDANVGNPAALNSLIMHNFTEKEISQEAEKTAKKAMDEYLLSISDRLNANQREELKKLAETSPNTN
jgi:hypothetical protein